jgi:hypothetical protein
MTDPQFGPVLSFGLGGVFVEALRDVSFRIIPITATLAGHFQESICEIDVNPLVVTAHTSIAADGLITLHARRPV